MCSSQSAQCQLPRTLAADLQWLHLPDNHSLGRNTWIVIQEMNRSSEASMVTESGRTSVVLFGSFLSVWTILFHLLLWWLLVRGRVSKSSSTSASPKYPGRWFILNFSLGQLLVAGFIIPLNVVTERAGLWRFGPGLCRVWLSSQVILVALTMWSLFVVTLDRLLYVVQPLMYAGRVGCKIVAAGLVLPWLLALATLTPLLIALEKPDFLLEDMCAVSMTKQHAITMSFAVFVGPAVLMLVATAATLVATLQAKLQQRLLQREALGGEDDSEDTRDMRWGECSESCCCVRCRCVCCLGRCCPDVSYVTYSEYSHVGGVALAVIIVNVATIAMWSPFYITNVLIPFCHGMCVNPALWSLFIWLGYASAGVTPVLWLMDPDIRDQLRSIMTCSSSRHKGTHLALCQ